MSDHIPWLPWVHNACFVHTQPPPSLFVARQGTYMAPHSLQSLLWYSEKSSIFTKKISFKSTWKSIYLLRPIYSFLYELTRQGPTGLHHWFHYCRRNSYVACRVAFHYPSPLYSLCIGRPGWGTKTFHHASFSPSLVSLISSHRRGTIGFLGWRNDN